METYVFLKHWCPPTRRNQVTIHILNAVKTSCLTWAVVADTKITRVFSYCVTQFHHKGSGIVRRDSQTSLVIHLLNYRLVVTRVPVTTHCLQKSVLPMGIVVPPRKSMSQPRSSPASWDPRGCLTQEPVLRSNRALRLGRKDWRRAPSLSRQQTASSRVPVLGDPH